MSKKEVRVICENCGPIDPTKHDQIDWDYLHKGGRCLVCGGKFTIEEKPKHSKY